MQKTSSRRFKKSIACHTRNRGRTGCRGREGYYQWKVAVNPHSARYGVDPVGFFIGGVISLAILAFADHGLAWQLVRFPFLTAIIGYPIGAYAYAQARDAYERGLRDGRKDGDASEEPLKP